MDKLKQEINIEHEKMNNRFFLKMSGIICSAILSFIALIGVFWGREGLIFIGMITLVIGIFSMASFTTTY